MISMKFLDGHVDGLEFIEFQKSDLYRKLSEHIKSFIDEDNKLDQKCAAGIKALLKEHTGFSNIKITFKPEGNFNVDVGFFSPNHVINNQFVDDLLKVNETTLYRWFSKNKDKIFKGSIDYKTGKVDGSFAEVPVIMNINPDLNQTFPKDKVAKFGVPLEGVVAGAIAHETGHIFGACMMLQTNASDNVLAKAALMHYRGANKEDRVVVLKDIASVLDMKVPKQDELESLAGQEGDETIFLYFNKMISQRNTSRSLSVGVSKMSSEVVADMYAIRMGCDKGVIAAIAILTDHGCITTVLNSLIVAGLLTTLFTGNLTIIALILGAPVAPTFAMVGTFFSVMFFIDYFGRGYSGVYNADHRRMDDALRGLIAKFKDDKNIDSNQRKELVLEIEKLLVLNNKLKPWFANTAIYRAVGWLFSGSDFKAQEVEHYTQVLSNHELNLFSHQLKQVV